MMRQRGAIPNVLSIAGSDPSGGAGVQADLKAFAANRVHGMAAITALTAQNTTGVSAIHTPPPDFVAEQIRMIAADIRVHAVKIGMIATADVARAVAASLKGGGFGHVVLDPVMVAKGGARLLSEDAVEVVVRELAPLADIVTPNLEEAAALLGQAPARGREEMMAQARALLEKGLRAVLLKGGHLEGAHSPDLLMDRSGAVWLEGPRTPTGNTHGTGCTLSAALAARLALGESLSEAARSSKAYVAGAIAASGALEVGRGHGPIHHFHGLWG